MKELFLIHKLYEIGAIKFGEFKLKNGIVTPVYIDLRLTFSYPKLLVTLSELIHERVRDQKYGLVCGVPLTGLPIATVMSIQHSIPMLICRKERKEYGTQRQIEGVYEPSMRCLIVEDVITSGQSIFETINPLKEEKLVVEDIALVVDREQGGKEHLESKGFHVHPVISLSTILDELLKEKKITEEMHISVTEFIRNHQTHG